LSASKGLIEPLLPATVGLVVCRRGEMTEQLVKPLLVARQQDALVGVACSEHEPLAGGTEQ